MMRPRWTGAALLLATGVAACGGARAITRAHEIVDDTVRVVTPTGTLVGSRMRPRDVARPPVVLIHPGSGPTSRDGNPPGALVGNDHLRQLAESLAAHGIASVRIDKRGVGASRAALTMPPDSVTLGHFVRDARAWLEQLRADTAWGRVYALGHSEGGLIASIAARGLALDGVILVAAPGRRMGEIMRAQFADPERLPRAFYPLADSALHALETGAPMPAMRGPLRLLFSPVNERFLRSLLAEVPQARVAVLAMPVLVVQGTTDLQVTPRDAELLATAARRGTLAMLPGINHVMRRASGGVIAQQQSYVMPVPAVAREVVAPIVRFVGRGE
ncbi:MAG: alpha/beta fold hydrolase [Gemmatimonadaceae bacterium]|nr:alpha/beta fold hydrolase [Gemmatimonadaceae bacterium]